MQRQDYQKVFAISQSAIKAFKSKSIQKFKQIYIDKESDEDEDQDKFAFGSLVDTLAFQPELLNDRFCILGEDVVVPGEKVKQVVDKVFKEALEIVENKRKLNELGNLPEPLFVPNITNIYDWEELILKHARAIKYGGTTWTNSRILDNVFTDAAAYFNMLGTANGRAIITAAQNADAIEMVAALRTNKHTQGYFVQQEGENLLFQLEIFIDYHKDGLILPLKGALDIVRINHNARTIQVPDLKTTYNLDDFKRTANHFGYVYQASFYDFIVREWLKTYHGGKYQEYEFLPPINIAIDTLSKVPHIYEYNWEDIRIAREGADENEVSGWVSILDEISWHMQTGVWDRPKELYETGKIKLKIFK
jgi:hypothetical protein